MEFFDYIGETTKCEKKEKVELSKPKSWLKTVSAFANTNGGAIIFGISDANEFVGIEDSKGDSEKISDLIRTKMQPLPDVALDIVEEAGKQYIVLKIEAGENTPYYVSDSGSLTAIQELGTRV